MAFKSINPTTGELVKTIDELSDARFAEALEIAQRCYETSWRARSIAQRAEIVRTAARLMRERKELLAHLVTLEMGKLIAEARGEAELAASILEYYADRAESYLKPLPIPEMPIAVIETHLLSVIFGIEP
jgi:succinate-semialdehyde dehydrogenase/glutarate-semialdehyde dehydrogenase